MSRTNQVKKVLLVEPPKGKKYHTPYPPLALLKLAAYHNKIRDKVSFVQGFSDNAFKPDLVYITSLFTYAFEPVHDVIRYYSNKFKQAEIKVGGIYATLWASHLYDTFGDKIEVFEGLFADAEDLLPDYSLVPECKESILFSTRGCIRKCPFCSVPDIEPEFTAKKSIKHLIYPGHKKVTFWDNNILASPYWREIFCELEELNLEVDFNQGLDARLITNEVVKKLSKLKVPIIRLAYDSNSIRKKLLEAIELLKKSGVDGRRIIVYCLYNFKDSPSDFLNRIKKLMEWGVVAYPMRYEPLTPQPKNKYISNNWTAEELEMIAKARRVIGFGGAFPPHKGLVKKILNAKNFYEAFVLRPKKKS